MVYIGHGFDLIGFLSVSRNLLGPNDLYIYLTIQELRGLFQRGEKLLQKCQCEYRHLYHHLLCNHF